MPPRRKPTTTTAAKAATAAAPLRPNSQAHLKYLQSCVDRLVKSLPRQTFDVMRPCQQEALSPTFAPLTTGAKPGKGSRLREGMLCSESFSSAAPVVLHHPFWSSVPQHPNVHLTCAFCQVPCPRVETLEQPQSRRRYTPLCERCYTEYKYSQA